MQKRRITLWICYILFIFGMLTLMAMNILPVSAACGGDLVENSDTVTPEYLSINATHPANSEFEQSAAGQTFTASGDWVAGCVTFYFEWADLVYWDPEDSAVVARIYEADGDDVPTGDPLISSNPIKVSNMLGLAYDENYGNGDGKVDFQFVGSYTLESGQKYSVVLEGQNWNEESEYGIAIGFSHLQDVHPGVAVTYYAGGDSWGANSYGRDAAFWLYNNAVPNKPTNLLTNGRTNPLDLDVWEPYFSAVCVDVNEDDLTHYAIQVDDDSDFSSPMWDWGKTDATDFQSGERSPNINYMGKALEENTTYYWRIKFWDEHGLEGQWSTETAYFRISREEAGPRIIPSSAIAVIFLFGQVGLIGWLYLKISGVRDIQTGVTGVQSTFIFIAGQMILWVVTLGLLEL